MHRRLRVCCAISDQIEVTPAPTGGRSSQKLLIGSLRRTCLLLMAACAAMVPSAALAQSASETDSSNSLNPAYTVPSTSSNLLFPATLSPSSSNPGEEEGTATNWNTLVDGSFGNSNVRDSTTVSINNNTTLTYALNGSGKRSRAFVLRSVFWLLGVIG